MRARARHAWTTRTYRGAITGKATRWLGRSCRRPTSNCTRARRMSGTRGFLVGQGDSGHIGEHLAFGLRPLDGSHGVARTGQSALLIMESVRGLDNHRGRVYGTGIGKRGCRGLRPLLPGQSAPQTIRARSQASRLAGARVLEVVPEEDCQMAGTRSTWKPAMLRPACRDSAMRDRGGSVGVQQFHGYAMWVTPLFSEVPEPWQGPRCHCCPGRGCSPGMYPVRRGG